MVKGQGQMMFILIISVVYSIATLVDFRKKILFPLLFGSQGKDHSTGRPLDNL